MENRWTEDSCYQRRLYAPVDELWAPHSERDFGRSGGLNMRKVQINIVMEFFGDEASNGKSEKVSVYADSNNVWETICAGFHELVTVLQEKRELPSFGARTSHWDKQK